MAESSTPTATDGDGAKAGGAPADGRAAAGGPVVGEDGLARTPWAYGDPLLLTYYDTEWGLPVRDESGLFERLSLEGFQAGLSWLTILRKRERFREVFAGFDAEAVAGFGDTEIEALLSDPGIIRHRGKIEACIGNAQAILEMRSDGGIADFIWSFQPADTPRPATVAEVPTTGPESVALSKALKKRGFRFVGPTTMYALMEAIGMVDTHLIGSHRRGASGVWPA
ncbi:DNA-3-methyladenine glycosylase I [Brevibacterium casei]|uniref:DNA-3-methyladenine glycosylase I n=1 Tax=Brevibacterium ammoniilyticum TaxID=1046555 RepID=A0ABP9U2X0_9MICO|nr:DNA-3-methyladenine glycosylase I [Brevibacterium casei]MDH5147669.1 DNA-3-methyladenine glycosylase I [Brevibacterium casei]